MRSTRSVKEIASSILREIVTAGTNFLVNKYADSKVPRNQMLDMMSYGTNYDKLGLSSEAAYKHAPETERHAKDYPRTLWVGTTLSSEILANSANLDKIAHWCRLGQMATYE